MVAETSDLEQELQRNLKLRRELGGEIRLELLMENATVAKDDASHRREAPEAEGTLPNRLVTTAWITLGVIGLAIGTFLAIWLS
jgi:hypothetical protein